MTKEELAIGFRFLKDKGVYSAYMRYAARFRQGRKGYVVRFFNSAELKSLLSGAFIWGETPEGDKFWSRLDAEFLKLNCFKP